jgi:dienelactone hydrolase
MKRISRLMVSALLLISPNVILAAMREAPPPLAPPYAPQRKLLPSDSVRFDWHDGKRNRDVPAKIYFPTESAAPFPVIVFSHGLGGTREGYEYLAQQWAANGFVSVHLQHIGSDDSAWRGQAAPMQAMKQAANLQNAVDRPRDVSFAVDQLIELDKTDPKLKGKLDLTHLGIAGHSFGAQTSMLIAGQRLGGQFISSRIGSLSDDRFKAVLAMSESVPVNRAKLDEIYSPIHIPTFFMSGTEDDSPLGDTKANERRMPFDHIPANPSYLLILTGGDHMVFSGRPGRVRATDDAQQKILRVSSTAFFDGYLKGDASALKWLEGSFKTELGEAGTFGEKLK